MMSSEIQYIELEGHTIGFDVVGDMLQVFRPPAQPGGEASLLSQVFIGTLEALKESYLEPEEPVEPEPPTEQVFAESGE